MTVEVREIAPSNDMVTYDELCERSQYVKQLPNWPSGLIPQKGDIFETKQDIKPIGHVDDIPDSTPATTESTTVNWL